MIRVCIVPSFDKVAELIRRDDTNLATLAKPITDALRLKNPNIVKVVFDHEVRANEFMDLLHEPA